MKNYDTNSLQTYANARIPLTTVDALPIMSSAAAKAIIVGEHAVVYGAKAVAIPVVSMRMSVKLTRVPEIPGEPPKIKVLLGGRTVTSHLAEVVDEAFKALEIPPFSMCLEGHSSVLIGAGLGSSASLCIVVLKALALATGKTLTPATLSRLGNHLERRFHGNPSGLDTAVVAMEQVIAFVKGETPQVVPVATMKTGDGPKPWRFALLDSRARSSTLAMIQAAAPYFQSPLGPHRISRFDAVAEQTIQGLADGDGDAVASAMNEAHGLLGDAGVVGAALNDLVASARNLGVLAAKSTGAGGGGCVLALLDPSCASAQLTALQRRIGENQVFEVPL